MARRTPTELGSSTSRKVRRKIPKAAKRQRVSKRTRGRTPTELGSSTSPALRSQVPKVSKKTAARAAKRQGPSKFQAAQRTLLKQATKERKDFRKEYGFDPPGLTESEFKAAHRAQAKGLSRGARGLARDVGRGVEALSEASQAAAEVGGLLLPIPAGKAKVATTAAKLFKGESKAAKVAKVAPKTSRPRKPPTPKVKAARKTGRELRRGAAPKTKARKVARAAGKTAKGGAKAATYPIRHPIKTTKYSVAAQVPVAAVTGDSSELAKPFKAEGVVADVLHTAGEAVSKATPGDVAKNLVKDVFDLPAQTPAAIYIPAAGIVEAAQGDSSRLDKLWKDYKATGLLPAVASGDPGEALERIKEHPLFAALEARGAQAVVGRTAGAAARRAPSKRVRQVGSQQRKPLRVPGTRVQKERSYSPDLIEKAVQVAADRRRARKQGGQKAKPGGETRRILGERVDRIVAAEEGARRVNRDLEVKTSKAAQPKRKVDQPGVSLALQGIIRSPKTFAADLASYRRSLDVEAANLQLKIDRAKTRPSKANAKQALKANRDLRAKVYRMELKGDPEAIFASARANAPAMRAQQEALVEAGLLTAEQARKAAVMPYAITHKGAKYGKPRNLDPDEASRQLLDRENMPLTLKEIEADLKAQGVDVEFVSQRPGVRGAGSFYRSMFPDRQTLPKARRTGKATREGTLDANIEAVLEQRVRSQGIVDAVRGFDRVVGELSAKDLRFGSYQAAREAVRNPRAYGLPKNLKMVPVRLAPFGAKHPETRRAEEIFDALDPNDQLGRRRVAEDLAASATEPGPGPVVLLPEQAVKRLKEHYVSATTTRRAAQVISSTFKGVVLPTSPNWFLGNFVDVTMRSLVSGTVPWGRDAALGRRVLREVDQLDPEAAKRVRAGLAPGSIYGMATSSKVHRDARQFVDTPLAKFAGAMGALARTPGPKQVVGLYRKYRDAAFAFNDKFIERQAQYAQLGKAARREVRQETGKWHTALKMGDAAVADLAKGLLGTSKQIQYAKQIESILGQWTAHSPAMRAFLVDYAPFGTWARAASKFVFWTLPAKHPIKTAIVAAAYEMTENERDMLGLSHFAERPLPPNLQGSLPLGAAGLLGPQSVTSFGFTADYQKSLSTMIFPHLPMTELSGLDWTGSQLTHEDGTPLNVAERAAAVLGSTAEAYIPFMAMGKRILENGPVEGAVPRTLRPYDKGLTEYLRSLSESKEINVPATPAKPEPEKSGGGGGGGGWY